MPSFSCSSAIRAVPGNYALTLKITHNYVYQEPSKDTHKIKRRLPKDLDVLLFSDLVMTFSGSLDGTNNITELGVNNLSGLFVDDVDGLSKMTLTPSRPQPRTSRPHANLVSIDLVYIWKDTRQRTGCKSDQDLRELLREVNPFSTQLFLPFESNLNRLADQFVTYHLVGRHPLIFGSWCKKLDHESECFPSIARSITDIISRSSDLTFVSRCRRHIKTAKAHQKVMLRDSLDALSACVGAPISGESDDEGSEPSASALTDEEAICMSLEQLFRIGVPQPRFKAAAALSGLPPSPQDDDDLMDPSQDNAVTGTESGRPLSWSDLPDIDMDFPVIESQDSTPNTSDDFQEDWPTFAPESGSQDEYFTQSDCSLINSSDSSVSINTPPSQDSFPIRHLDSQVYISDFPLDLGPCRWRSQDCASVEDPGCSALHSFLPSFLPTHAPHDLETKVHLTLDHDTDVCQESKDDFEFLSSPVKVSFLDAEYEDRDQMLFDLEDALYSYEDYCSAPDYSPVTHTRQTGQGLSKAANSMTTSHHNIDTFSRQVDNEDGIGNHIFTDVLDFDI
ncbi:hypothetical protein BV22DRAFT_1194353 [Leucogyrophana mollusca]|uniref:Uncharacterized protein n=1 Tax=Leucogyrophana mollusca TaxID=85980 RepID=A0ACB8BKQ5_9AGAM|nr:hypothetical protein BV22DRAFT_1194353 [Leucogyrophana mollusca]